MVPSLADERVFDGVDIDIGECCKRKLVAELSYGPLELFVEKLGHLIERNSATRLVHLRCQDGYTF